MEPINNSKNKLNSEIIYNFHCFPNTHNTRLDLASSVSVFFFFFFLKCISLIWVLFSEFRVLFIELVNSFFQQNFH